MVVSEARGLDAKLLTLIPLPVKPGRFVRGAAKAGFLAGAATAVLGFLPLGAEAQALPLSMKPDTPSILETVTRPAIFAPEEVFPRFTSEVPVRASTRDFGDDSETDRERRSAIFTQCLLLDEIRSWTALDVVAGLPNGMMDWVRDLVRPKPDRYEVSSMRSPTSRSLVPRLLACPVGDGSRHPFDDLMVQVLYREQKYFARFQDSGLPNLSSDEGPEDIDTGTLMRDQQKILLSAGRKMYFGRYGALFDASFRAEALDFSHWHPVDFAVAPTAVAGYAYLLGWEQKFNVAGLRCSLQIEPLKHILDRYGDRDKDLVSAGGMEIGVGKFPIKAIISVGIMEGDALIDFIGIGTSLGKARQVISRELSALRDDE